MSYMKSDFERYLDGELVGDPVALERVKRQINAGRRDKFKVIEMDEDDDEEEEEEEEYVDDFGEEDRYFEDTRMQMAEQTRILQHRKEMEVMRALLVKVKLGECWFHISAVFLVWFASSIIAAASPFLITTYAAKDSVLHQLWPYATVITCSLLIVIGGFHLKNKYEFKSALEADEVYISEDDIPEYDHRTIAQMNFRIDELKGDYTLFNRICAFLAICLVGMLISMARGY
ncbi:hypothetical protein CRE_01161 [Caenorhabditis remanei]|uniref:Uncharacterized protein n=1 Tax=Caenorhabditis remanei TaxID=31234 RepID=E3MWJ8_CAERE|nr:hypothetical protein CRE_01161 [Caenorhabditis remanei]